MQNPTSRVSRWQWSRMAQLTAAELYAVLAAPSEAHLDQVAAADAERLAPPIIDLKSRFRSL